MRLQGCVQGIAASGIVLLAAISGCSAIDWAVTRATYPNLAKTRAAFLQSLGKTTVTVFPAFVRQGPGSYNDNAAATLAGFLNTEGLASATASDRHVPITGPWRMNQARMWKDSVMEFGAYVRANPIATRYALLPEYLCHDPHTFQAEAGGIHAYIVDAEGEVAYQVLLNSHWEEFYKANPKSVDDCTAVLVTVLRDRLKREAGRKR